MGMLAGRVAIEANHRETALGNRDSRAIAPHPMPYRDDPLLRADWLLPRPYRTQARFRRCGSEDVVRLKFIRRARQLGFTLNEVRALLRLSRADGDHARLELWSIVAAPSLVATSNSKCVRFYIIFSMCCVDYCDPDWRYQSVGDLFSVLGTTAYCGRLVKNSKALLILLAFAQARR